MSTDRDIVAHAFENWAAGTGHVTSIFADDMRWEIVGRNAASGTYTTTRQFIDEVLQPFGARFSTEQPFRPVRIRGIYHDIQAHTVTVVWDGEGTTTIGTIYRNTYAWIMRMRAGKVIEGTAFYDSIAFDELWGSVLP